MAALNFPNGPSVGDKYPTPAVVGQPQYTWDGEKWTTFGNQVTNATPSATVPLMDATPGLAGTQAAYSRGDHVHPTDTTRAPLTYVDANMVGYAAQTATAAQKSQARANIAVTKKNYIVNGGMMVSQENGSTAVTSGYPVDQFYVIGSATTGTINAAQVVSTSPAGSPNRIRITVAAADAAVGTTDLVYAYQRIEALRLADLMPGTASAKTVTLQFGVRAPAGTYCVWLSNGATNRTYIAEYVVASGEANTDVVKSVTLTMDTAGTWETGAVSGFIAGWTLMCGSNYQKTAGSWGAGFFAGSSNQFNFMGTAGNILELFDVSLTEGTIAPPFQVPDYVSELALCMRYYRKTTGEAGTEPTHYGWGDTGASVGTTFIYPVPMRASPSITMTGTWVVAGSANTQPSIVGQNATSCGLYVTGNLTGRISFQPNNSGRVNFNARL